MNRSDRDALIRTALTPGDDIRLPAGLTGDIHRSLLVTPQRTRPVIGVTGIRWLQVPGGAVLWVLLLAATGVVLALAAFLLLPRPPADTDVLTFHGNAGRTGVLPGPGPQEPPMIAWEVGVTGQLLWLNMPLLRDDTVYVADKRGGVTALDMNAMGAEKWHASVGADVSATPHIAGGLLIVPAESGVVTAFDLASGDVRWATDIGAPAKAAPAGFERFVLVGSDHGRVHALDSVSGAEKWSADARAPLARAPAVSADTAYVGTEGHVTAFHAGSGRERWTKDIGDQGIGSPVVDNGVLYLTHGAEGGPDPYQVFALDVTDGNELWSWTAPTTGLLGIGAVAGDTVYVTSASGGVYAIDGSSGLGRLLFTAGAAVPSPSTYVDGVLYFSSDDGNVYAVDAVTGTLRWVVPVTGRPGTPVVVGGRVIVGTDLGRVVVLEAGTAAS